MKNFDCFVGIDWSGSKSPVRNRAISVALCGPGQRPPKLIKGPWSRESVAAWLATFIKENKRTLVGIDCNFGYAQEVGEAQFGRGYDYQDLWQAVDAANENIPNYFAGGYWTHPSHQKYFWTAGKMPQGFEMPKRLTEMTCGQAGYGWPESPFKLIGAKQVGKGGLAGMRMALDLKHKFDRKIAIWPFERETDRSNLVLTEIYPRQFLRRTGHGNLKLRSLKELNIALTALHAGPLGRVAGFTDHDGDALVSAAGLRYLCGQGKDVHEAVAWPSMLDDLRARREGWIFGVGDI